MEPISLPKGRQRLSAVIRAAGDVIEIDDVVVTLAMDRVNAAKLLSRWKDQGWLRRVGPGAYVAVGLDSLESGSVLADPWVLVPALYAPCYIGGRTAAEHWDLTEQLFRDIVVFTSKPVRRSRELRHGALFSLHHIKEEDIFGTRAVWRDSTKVSVSDLHRTILDIFNKPEIGGGIQHVADCFTAYLRRSDRDDQKLLDYADMLGNGAVFKRMGFLAERDGSATSLEDACSLRLTKGNARLDPKLECSELVTRWRLWVPSLWKRTIQHDRQA